MNHAYARTGRDDSGQFASGAPKLNWESAGRVLASHFADRHVEPLDLSEFTVLSPDGLTWLLALTAWRARQENWATEIHLPRDPRTLAYLRELGFVDLYQLSGGLIVNEFVLWNSEIDRIEDRLRRKFESAGRNSPRFIQRVGSNWQNVIGGVHAYFMEYFPGRLGVDALSDVMWDSRPFQYAVEEIIMNVAVHAGVGFACYRPWRNHPVLRFSCSDVGGGFLATLRHKAVARQPKTDVAAILEGLLYRHYAPESGVIGLYNALEFLRSFRGRLQIHSGSGVVELDLRSQAHQKQFDEGYASGDPAWLRKLCQLRTVPAVAGTHIALDLTTPRAAH